MWLGRRAADVTFCLQVPEQVGENNRRRDLCMKTGSVASCPLNRVAFGRSLHGARSVLSKVVGPFAVTEEFMTGLSSSEEVNLHGVPSSLSLLAMVVVTVKMRFAAALVVLGLACGAYNVVARLGCRVQL
jgi:hypothetical protein